MGSVSAKTTSNIRLKEDRNFTPCTAAIGDEMYPNGVFVFNITAMLRYIADNPEEVELTEIEVDDFTASFSHINESHIGSVDISQPAILAEMAPAYRLSVRQHIRFLTSKSAYLAYIKYWNSKLK